MHQPPHSPIIAFHIDMNFICLPLPYLRHWLGRIAEMGYNAIVWELENKVQWDTCPECVWPEAMSKQQFRELLELSRSLGLEPIPLMQTIGHGEYVLKHDKYRPFRELPDRHDCYCTTHSEVRAFLRRWIEEYIELFGDLRYFHLGGDEAYVFAQCPRCAARAAEIGCNALYAEHITDIAQPLVKRGIRPGIWSDMILHYPDQVDQIPRDLVIWDWNYHDGVEPPHCVHVWGRGRFTRDQIDPALLQQIPELIDESGRLRPFHSAAMLRRLGYDVILCSATRSAGDSICCSRHSLHAPNVIGASQTARRLGLMGTCVTSWAIRISSYETQEPWIALAPAAYHQPEASVDALLRQTAQRLVGMNDTAFFDAIEQIGVPILFARSHSRTANGIQWNDLKDSLPPPPGYLAQRLQHWTSGRQARNWAREIELIQQAPARIAAGRDRLQDLQREATQGSDCIRQWLAAADFQLAFARIGQDVAARVSGQTSTPPQEMLVYLQGLKSDFAQWTSTWMTPQSAWKNAGLVFDCVREYYESA